LKDVGFKFIFTHQKPLHKAKKEIIKMRDVHRVDSLHRIYNVCKCRMISFWKEKSSSRLDELLNSVAILRTISANSYVGEK